LYDGEKFQQAEKSAGSGMGAFLAEFGFVPAPMFRKSGPGGFAFSISPIFFSRRLAFDLLFAVKSHL
jgi:hypothetical protein